MLLVDALIAAVAIAVIVTGTLRIMSYRRKKVPEIQGADNAREALATSRRRCHFCKKDTDPRKDVFANDSWYHRDCFLNNNEQKGKYD